MIPNDALLSLLSTLDHTCDAIIDLPPSDAKEEALGAMIVARDTLLAKALQEQGKEALLEPDLLPHIRAHVSNSLYAETLSLVLSGQPLPGPLDTKVALDEIFEKHPDLIDSISLV